MSSTTIKAIWISDRIENLETLRNSWGGANVVWGKMATRYLGVGEFDWMSNADRLWALTDDSKILRRHRAVLMMTYDKAYVAKKDYRQAAEDILAFLADFPVETEYVNHWPHIAALFQSDPAIPAIGFHWTSVVEDPFRGAWNEELEDYGPIDWADVYDMYAELDEIDKKDTL